MNRRDLLTLLSSAAIGSRLNAQLFLPRKKVKPAANPLVYFGTDTAKPGAKGIYLARFDPLKGQFTAPTLAAETLRPVYLALNEVGGRRVLYATNEGTGSTSTVTTFLVDPTSGALKQIGQVSSGGNGPCYIAVDGTGHFAFVANYTGGTVTSYRVLPDGTLSQPLESLDFHGKQFGARGPHARQDGPHPHSSQVSPDNRFLLVNDLGHDAIVVMPLHQDGKLGAPTLIQNRVAGAGPRHLAFHPNGRWAYGIDELTNRIDCYLWNTTHAVGTQEPQAFLTDAGRSVSTLDAGFHGTNTAAEIEVSANGYYLYASNRGENSLVVFAIDQGSGALKEVQRISCGGKTPRHFTLDPAGNWLICGNQESASVTVFARNGASGRLTGPVQTLALESPVFTLFL